MLDVKLKILVCQTADQISVKFQQLPLRTLGSNNTVGLVWILPQCQGIWWIKIVANNRRWLWNTNYLSQTSDKTEKWIRKCNCFVLEKFYWLECGLQWWIIWPLASGMPSSGHLPPPRLRGGPEPVQHCLNPPMALRKCDSCWSAQHAPQSTAICAARRRATWVRTEVRPTSLRYSVTSVAWLLVLERIAYRLAVLAFRCQHGTAPPYLSAELSPVADDDSRRRLRSANTAALVIPRTKHSTIGDRAFPVAAARVWNSLPPLVSSSPSLSVFKRRLKTELFTRSYPAA